MQVTEVASEGLKREYKVVFPASEINERVESRLKKLAKTARIPGFRPGKAPLTLLKKQYGRSVMGEVLEEAVNEGSQKAIAEKEVRPALRPKIEVTSFDDGKDLEFKIDLEVLPDVPEVEFKGIPLTRQVAPVDESRIEESIQNLASMRQSFKDLDEPRPAADKDELTIDFVGTIDGEPFDGGSAEDHKLVLGSGRMIPGFEEQLVGVEAGEERTVKVTFPEDYGHEPLRGKEAAFAVKVKAIREPEPLEIDDEFAKSFGTEGLDDLRAKLKERMEQEFQGQARAKMKRQLLDHLAEAHDFEVPAGMVDLEFDAIWNQLTQEMERTGSTFESMEESEEEARAEYRRIAERRVRLGLILSDIGTKNEVTVEPQELQQALMEQARRHPGQEREIFEYFQKTPGAIEQLRAPIFEDKVVDFIIGVAEVTDQPVSVEELMKDPDAEDEAETAAEETAGDDAKA